MMEVPSIASGKAWESSQAFLEMHCKRASPVIDCILSRNFLQWFKTSIFQAYVSQSVLDELKRIVEDSEIMQEDDANWPEPDKVSIPFFWMVSQLFLSRRQRISTKS